MMQNTKDAAALDTFARKPYRGSAAWFAPSDVTRSLVSLRGVLFFPPTVYLAAKCAAAVNLCSNCRDYAAPYACGVCGRNYPQVS